MGRHSLMLWKRLAVSGSCPEDMTFFNRLTTTWISAFFGRIPVEGLEGMAVGGREVNDR